MIGQFWIAWNNGIFRHQSPLGLLQKYDISEKAFVDRTVWILFYFSCGRKEIPCSVSVYNMIFSGIASSHTTLLFDYMMRFRIIAPSETELAVAVSSLLQFLTCTVSSDVIYVLNWTWFTRMTQQTSARSNQFSGFDRPNIPRIKVSTKICDSIRAVQLTPIPYRNLFRHAMLLAHATPRADDGSVQPSGFEIRVCFGTAEHEGSSSASKLNIDADVVCIQLDYS